MSDIENETYSILADLEALEGFYTKDYIDLKTYYKIKNEILLKYIAVGEHYKSEVMELIQNDVWTDSKFMEGWLFQNVYVRAWIFRIKEKQRNEE